MSQKGLYNGRVYLWKAYIKKKIKDEYIETTWRSIFQSKLNIQTDCMVTYLCSDDTFVFGVYQNKLCCVVFATDVLG